VRRLLATGACLFVAGCGGGSEAQSGAPAGVANDVKAMFRAYTQAMGREDFRAACTHLTEGSITHLAAEVDKVAPGAKDCPGLLDRLYGKPGSRTRQDLRELARTVEVSSVDTTKEPDVVLLSWSAEVRGRRVAIRQPVQRVGAKWQLVAAPSLTG